MYTKTKTGIDFDPKTKLYFAYIVVGRLKMDIDIGQNTYTEAETALGEYLENKAKKEN